VCVCVLKNKNTYIIQRQDFQYVCVWGGGGRALILMWVGHVLLVVWLLSDTSAS
jgi:hypothetical protein